ncbi:hypothetical protein FA15DRAFT_674779 [Coprinopsis marcescibilis]|uniref:Uncharacterized protein n=1 Tax=Coprinopsis marcescibilis TaxID=230819 RepID=A0A5C3KH32_COPMA|nr:hypothetical protein FA15DRAFT_674779 [Coprinopsis marcescibilis]
MSSGNSSLPLELVFQTLDELRYDSHNLSRARQSILACSSVSKALRTYLYSTIFHRARITSAARLKSLHDILLSNPDLTSRISSLQLCRETYESDNWFLKDKHIPLVLALVQDTLREFSIVVFDSWRLSLAPCHPPVRDAYKSLFSRGKNLRSIILEAVDVPRDLIDSIAPSVQRLSLVGTSLVDARIRHISAPRQQRCGVQVLDWWMAHEVIRYMCEERLGPRILSDLHTIVITHSVALSYDAKTLDMLLRSAPNLRTFGFVLRPHHDPRTHFFTINELCAQGPFRELVIYCTIDDIRDPRSMVDWLEGVSAPARPSFSSSFSVSAQSSSSPPSPYSSSTSLASSSSSSLSRTENKLESLVVRLDHDRYRAIQLSQASSLTLPPSAEALASWKAFGAVLGLGRHSGQGDVDGRRGAFGALKSVVVDLGKLQLGLKDIRRAARGIREMVGVGEREGEGEFIVEY